MQQSDITIRPFRADDLNSIQAIREAAFAPVFQSFRALSGEDAAPFAFAKAEEQQGDYLAKMCDPDDPHVVLVALVGETLAGFCGYLCDPVSKTGEISLNAVDPGVAGQGIGTRLYDHAISEMRQAGMRAARVGTGSDDSHAPARRAYQKAGFDHAIPSVLYVQAL